MAITNQIIDPSTSQELAEASRSPRPNDPLSLLQQAMDAGANAEQLEKISAVAERWMARQSEIAFSESMNRCQQELPVVVRDAKGERGRYAKLETVSQAIKPVIMQHGFSCSYTMIYIDSRPFMQISVKHSGGHTERHTLPFSADTTGPNGKPNKTEIQGIGSGASYLRRYLKLQAFDITIADEDNDGSTPLQKPESDSTQPTNGTREAGYAQPTEPAKTGVLVKHVEALQLRWAAWTKHPQPVSNECRDAFIAWIDKTLGVEIAEWTQGAWFEQAMWDKCDQGTAWMRTLLAAMK